MEHDWVVAEMTAAFDEAREDHQWLLTRGVVGEVDKVLDSKEFGLGVNLFQDGCLNTAHEEGKQEY